MICVQARLQVKLHKPPAQAAAVFARSVFGVFLGSQFALLFVCLDSCQLFGFFANLPAAFLTLTRLGRRWDNIFHFSASNWPRKCVASEMNMNADAAMDCRVFVCLFSQQLAHVHHLILIQGKLVRNRMEVRSLPRLIRSL